MAVEKASLVDEDDFAIFMTLHKFCCSRLWTVFGVTKLFVKSLKNISKAEFVARSVSWILFFRRIADWLELFRA